ncbi:MAG: PDZ domain-containing protein [Chthonomonadales bacterium]|nr:PDZ domain-containing protein [Chthonomonadales bacterium]
MKLRVLLLLCAVLLVGAASTRASALAGPILYEVSVASLPERRFQVTVSAETGGARAVRFAIPAWTPGYYQILHFEKNIEGFAARGETGRELRVTRPDERSWEVRSDGALRVTASYQVVARDSGFGFFGSHLDDATGYVNGPSALMYIVGRAESPAELRVSPPTGWAVACSLAPAGDRAFSATGYDELVDCPLQIGAFTRVEFRVGPTPFSAVVVGADQVDREGLADMLGRIGAAGVRLFGSAPFDRYIFFLHMSRGSFSGGLEHRNSTVLNLGPGSATHVRQWQELAAHEYFHAWNVKRIRPAGLGPFDYTRAVRTPSLWFSEGVTDYYASVLLRMAGLTDEQEFLDEMAGRIRNLQRSAARLRVSAEEASRRTWEGGSMGYGGLSYYVKGSMLGLLFDVEIRAATRGRAGLDDVMRLLDQHYGQANRAFGERAIREAINTVAGANLGRLYDRYVRSTAEIPWDDVMEKAGLRYSSGEGAEPYIGMSVEPARDGTHVLWVDDESPAHAAGLQAGDRIVSANDEIVTPEAWEARVAALRIGQELTFGVRRGGGTERLRVTVGSRASGFARLAPLPEASPLAAAVRRGLLRADDEARAAAPRP